MFRWFMNNFIHTPPDRANRLESSDLLRVVPVLDNQGDYMLSFEKFIAQEMTPPPIRIDKLPVKLKRADNKVRLLSFHPNVSRPPKEDEEPSTVLPPSTFDDPELHIPFHHGLYINPRITEESHNPYGSFYKKIRVYVNSNQPQNKETDND